MTMDALYDYIGDLDWATARLIEDLFIVAAKYPFELKHRKEITSTNPPNLRDWLNSHGEHFHFEHACRQRGGLLMTRLNSSQLAIQDHPTGILTPEGYPPHTLWISHQPEWLLSWIPKRVVPNVQKTLELNHEGPCTWAHTFTPDFQLNQTHSNPPWHHLPRTNLSLAKHERVIRVAPCTVKAFADVWKCHAPLD